jgi:hypothetical protein
LRQQRPLVARTRTSPFPQLPWTSDLALLREREGKKEALFPPAPDHSTDPNNALYNATALFPFASLFLCVAIRRCRLISHHPRHINVDLRHTEPNFRFA